MSIKPMVAPLSLIGMGYLENVTFFNNRYVARLTLLPCYNTEGRTKDEVTLNCLVKAWELQRLLDALDCQRNQGASVIVKFAAHYQQVNCTFPTMTDSDPEQLVTMDASLSHITAAYVDGVHYANCAAQVANE